MATLAVCILAAPIMHLGCRQNRDYYYWKPVEVTISAYNSVPWQTDSLASLAAWGDTLRPGMKCVAISQDLARMGLDYNMPIRIEGLEGMYLVKDKMHPRWHHKIDIYMGNDVKRAKAWGRKMGIIRYPVKKDPIAPSE